MAIRELDMGIPRDELIAGMARVLGTLGVEAAPVREGDIVRFAGPGEVTIEIGPMPEERIAYPVLFPRTLVVLKGEERAIDDLYLRMVPAFLRPTG